MIFYISDTLLEELLHECDIRSEVVVVDPATIVDPADGLKVQEKMRAGVLLCVEFCVYEL